LLFDPTDSDYSQTPASDTRAQYPYIPAAYGEPLLSIVTPYYNLGSVFQETILSVERMSFTHWEWLIVDDGSTLEESVKQLADLEQREKRVRVLRQDNKGPAAARNYATEHARGKYLLLLDADDMVEPTFVERALWFLETQPEFAFCGSWSVSFGESNYLWTHGFEQAARFLERNWVHISAVIRVSAHQACGGFDTNLERHEDWDYWLRLASVGCWGYSLPEYGRWYRQRSGSRMAHFRQTPELTDQLGEYLREKYGYLASAFPNPQLRYSTNQNTSYQPEVLKLPFSNRLEKPEGVQRVLLLIPWMRTGGAERFNLQLVELLSKQDYQFTVVTTQAADSDSFEWLHLMARYTPDVFRLDTLLSYSDYLRFFCYVIESRQIDIVFISCSDEAYRALPYLRARYPNLTFVDYVHSEWLHFRSGGFAGVSVAMQSQLDATLTCSQHLKDWMCERGCDPDRVRVNYVNIDTELWDASQFDRAALREEYQIKQDAVVLVFAARLVAVKRPLLVAEIMRRLAAIYPNIVCLVLGDGTERTTFEAFITQHQLDAVRCLGTVRNEQVRKVLALADILLLPSQSEGLPLILYEALAMGVIPVAADVGGIRELVTPDCGYLIPHSQEEIDRYVETIGRLIEHPDQAEAMRQQGRERVVTHFNQTQMVQTMVGSLDLARANAAERSATSLPLALAEHFALDLASLQQYTLTLLRAKDWHKRLSERQESKLISTQETVQRLSEEVARLKAREQELVEWSEAQTQAVKWLEGQLQAQVESVHQRQAYIETLIAAKTWLEGQVTSWQETARVHEERIAELEVAKTWLEGQVASWQGTAQVHEERIAELEEAKTWLEGQVTNWQETAQAHEGRIAELEEAKTWLEGQVTNWQGTAQAHEGRIAELETAKALLEGQVTNWQGTAQVREEQITELEEAKAWLEGQVTSWQGTAQAYEGRIGKLEEAKAWLEGQVTSWQETAKARGERIVELETAKAWLEGQVTSWQETAKARGERIVELETAKAWLEGQVTRWKQLAEEYQTATLKRPSLLQQLLSWIKRFRSSERIQE
jgi:glycosyltransferase involved in cell wall biosynthesis